MAPKIYTREEFMAEMASENFEEQEDNSGQIVIYTGFFNWRDGTIRDEEDPSWDDE